MGGSSSKNKNEKNNETPTPTSNKEKENKEKLNNPNNNINNNNNNINNNNSDFEQRLTRFYEYYNPEKVQEVPQIIKNWKGTQEQIIQAMIKRYGPEPTNNNNNKMKKRKKNNDNTNNDNNNNNEIINKGINLETEVEVNKENIFSETSQQVAIENENGNFFYVEQTEENNEIKIQNNETEEEKEEQVQPGYDNNHDIYDETNSNNIADNNNNNDNDNDNNQTDYHIENALKESNEPELSELNNNNNNNNNNKPDLFKRRLSGFLGVRAPHKLYTLESCLQRYSNNEEELFEFLYQTYGEEPAEDEIIFYFINRLRNLYAAYDPSKVPFAETEIISHYNVEEEYLQEIAKQLGEDAMMMKPIRERNNNLFEYTEINNFKEIQNETLNYDDEKEKSLSQPLLNEEKENFQENDINESNNNNNENHEENIYKPNPIEHTETFSLHSQLQSEENCNNETEKYRRLFEEQQQQLIELQNEIQRLRNIIAENSSNNLQEEQQQTIIIKENNERRSSPHSYHHHNELSLKSNNSPNLLDSKVNYRKNSPLNRHINNYNNSVDDLLPPPPHFHPPRKSQSKVREFSFERLSQFISRKPFSFSSSSSTQRVQTLAEMRLEYEREREAIRSAERQLNPYNVLV